MPRWESGGPGRLQLTLRVTTESGTCDYWSGLVPPPDPVFRRGDSNGDGDVNISDPVHILNWLFAGGPAPKCLASANANGDNIASHCSRSAEVRAARSANAPCQSRDAIDAIHIAPKNAPATPTRRTTKPYQPTRRTAET